MDAEMRGLVGAATGLGLGIVDYLIASRIFENARLNGNLEPSVERIGKGAITLGAFVVFPVLGYVVGRFVWA